MKKGSRPVLVILVLVIAAGAAAGFWGFRNYQFQRSLARYFTGRYEQVPYARGFQALEEALEQYREDGLPGSLAQVCVQSSVLAEELSYGAEACIQFLENKGEHLFSSTVSAGEVSVTRADQAAFSQAVSGAVHGLVQLSDQAKQLGDSGLVPGERAGAWMDQALAALADAGALLESTEVPSSYTREKDVAVFMDFFLNKQTFWNDFAYRFAPQAG